MATKTIKKSINISEELVERIEKSIQYYPGLNFTLVVNQALEQWLKGPQRIELVKDREYFITDSSIGNGPKAKGRK